MKYVWLVQSIEEGFTDHFLFRNVDDAAKYGNVLLSQFRAQGFEDCYCGGETFSTRKLRKDHFQNIFLEGASVIIERKKVI